MSNRERAIQIIDSIPDNKLMVIIDILEALQAHINGTMTPETVQPDEWDMTMIAEAEKVNNGETVSLDEMLTKDGLTYADLQD